MTTPATDRIVALDAIRGVAVMGILFLNIIVFAMPQAAATNPAAYGFGSPIDRWVWIADFVLLDGRMRGLFSFLFGASLLLVVDRAGDRGRTVHFRRMAALLAFGIGHAVLVWHGDILVQYAAVGCLAWLFRDLSPRRMVAVGLMWLALSALVMGSMPLTILSARTATIDPVAAQAIVRPFADSFTPDAARIAAEIALYRGGYGGIVADNLTEFGRTLASLWMTGAETMGYMLLGMAALRSGMLTGRWRRRSYAAWAVLGLGIGGVAHAWIAAWMMGRGFDLVSVTTGLALLPIRVPMVLGWAALILLSIRPGGRITGRVAAAGRMAFTNYLMTSVVMCVVFYGYGLGLFGQLSRAETLVPLIAMCGAMLAWSQPWLARFRYGPLEWAWRSLARGRLHPMRVEPSVAPRRIVATDTQ